MLLRRDLADILLITKKKQNKTKRDMKKEDKEKEQKTVENTGIQENIKENQEKEEQNEAKLEEASGKDMQKELAELTEKCADLADKNLRLMAEFDNYRKRTQREKADIIKNAGEKIFKDMLPIIDDFERALSSIAQTEENASLREGVELIYNKFVNFLSQNGVKPIETENADFNVEFHEAITTIPAPNESLKGKIVDCTTKGYMLNEKVLRFAKVVVGE